MPRHRNLNLKKFIDSIPESLLVEYFELRLQVTPLPISSFDLISIKDFLENFPDKSLTSIINEEFTHMYDICERNMNHLVDAINRYRIETTGEEKREELAMIIFLNHKAAYDYAYDKYCLYASSSKMSHYNISATDFEINDTRIERFKQKVSSFYSNLAKGHECTVRYYDDEGQTVIVVIHGSYKRSVSTWQGSTVKTMFFRPANEDILQFSKVTSVLSIKAPYQKDKDNYINVFTEEILEDTSQANREDMNNSYTLLPLQDGTFSFNGNEKISSITLLEIKLALRGSTNPAVIIKSRDVMQTLLRDINGLNLQSGDLVHAKFKFGLSVDDKLRMITFEITPPNVTDLTKKRYADIIGSYLKENGVKLV